MTDASAALSLLDSISIELALRGKLVGGLLLPKVAELRKLITESPGKQMVQTLSALSEDGNDENFATFVGTLEGLQEHLRGAHPARQMPANALLTYDINQDKDILNSFFAEVNAHLQNIEQRLLDIETNATDRNSLDAIFGALHSLKGISGFLEASAMRELAHEAEAIVDRARNRPGGIFPKECDAILSTVDVLREIAESLLAHSQNPQQPFPAVPRSMAALLIELQRNQQAPAENLAPPAKVAPSAEGGTEAAPAPTTGATVVLPGVEQRSGMRAFDQAGLVRVKVEKLDALLDTVGELVVTHTQIQEDPALQSLERSSLERNLAQLNKIVRSLQDVSLSLRMYPLRETFARMTRLVRDLSRKENKEIEVSLSGEDTEVDKSIIEGLIDPLTHIIRNAIDHGIELPQERIVAGKPARATIALGARHQGSEVVIEISDDGRGLDPVRIARKARERGLAGADEQLSSARIRSLIFEPGFSTADKVTDLSGRGIGLDVVKKNVAGLGGRVTVDSDKGRSTRFTVNVPLTLAIIDALLVRTGGSRFVVPLASVVESFRPAAGQVSTVHQRGEILEFRGNHLPLVRLHEYAHVEPDSHDPCAGIAMVVECQAERCAVLVDELLGQQQVVIKSLGKRLRGVKGLAGGAILGDGRVGLMLDLAQIVDASRMVRT